MKGRPRLALLRLVVPGRERAHVWRAGALQQRFGLDAWCKRLTQRALKRGGDSGAGECEAAALRSRLHRVFGSERE